MLWVPWFLSLIFLCYILGEAEFGVNVAPTTSYKRMPERRFYKTIFYR